MKLGGNDWAAYTFLIAFFCIVLESFSLVAFKADILKNRVFKGVKNLTENEFNKYLEERDHELGWPTKSRLAQKHTGNGFRKSPALELISNEQPPCLAVYGDSFAFGDELSDADAWPNQLTQIFGCKVLNYGVSAYGTDQAVMRFEKLHPDGAPALMTFIDLNLMRNRNQARGISKGLINVSRTKPIFVENSDSASTPSRLKK